MELYFKKRAEWRKWLNSAKRAETRTRRIISIVSQAEQNKRPGMM